MTRLAPRLRGHQKRLAALHPARETLFNHNRFHTLFYPGCGTDWKPLNILNTTCDLFIFCDCSMETNSVPDDLAIHGFQQIVSFDLDQETVHHLSDKSLLPRSWRIKIGGHEGPEPWGKYASFDRTRRGYEKNHSCLLFRY